MKRKKSHLLASLLWFALTLCWALTVFMDIHKHSAPKWLLILHCAVGALSLIIALIDLIRYRKSGGKGEEDEKGEKSK